jgi:hypothetical protein
VISISCLKSSISPEPEIGDASSPLIRDLAREVAEAFENAHPGRTGHDNGGAIGVDDRLNRAHAALAAMVHAQGAAYVRRWIDGQPAAARLREGLERALAQTRTPDARGRVEWSHVSDNPTVPSAKVQALFERRLARPRDDAALDMSDNSLLRVWHAPSPAAAEQLLWDALVQLRARRRSAQWTDRRARDARRDETEGKLTGSGIATVLELRMLLAHWRRWAGGDDRLFWLFSEVVRALPFLDVSCVFGARNLVSALRDIVGRADVAVRYIGDAPRERVPLYAAIHQHYAADTAALVRAWVRSRVLAGDDDNDALEAFLVAADRDELDAYLPGVRIAGFRRCDGAAQREALHIVARLLAHVMGSVPSRAELRRLLPYTSLDPALYDALDAPRPADVTRTAQALDTLRASVFTSDGHVALQRLRAFLMLSQWCSLHASSLGERARRQLRRTLANATGWAALGRDAQGAHDALASAAARAARRVVTADVDVELDPRFVDGLLKESPWRLAPAPGASASASWLLTSGRWTVDRLVSWRPGLDASARDAVFLRSWDDDVVLRASPRVVLFDADARVPPLSHARFRAREKGIALVQVRAGLRARKSRCSLVVDDGCLTFEPPGKDAPAPSGGPRIVARGRDDDGDWAHAERGRWTIAHPAPGPSTALASLDDLAGDEPSWAALERAGAKAVLLAKAQQTCARHGALVPHSVVVPFAATAALDADALVAALERRLPTRRRWLVRSAGVHEDLPGHSQAGEHFSRHGARSRAARADALREVAGQSRAPMSLLVQVEQRADKSGVTFSRGDDGTMGVARYQALRGGGGGVRGDVDADGVLRRDERPPPFFARSPKLARALYGLTLDLERALNATFFPSGDVLHPVEVEWLVDGGRLFVVQVRFQ